MRSEKCGWYTNDLQRPLCETCGCFASKRLFDQHGRSKGTYCTQCARVAIAGEEDRRIKTTAGTDAKARPANTTGDRP